MPSGSLITMPSSPWPSGVEVAIVRIAASVPIIFNGKRQINDWGPGPCEASATLPPMSQSSAAAWVTFFKNCQGIVNYFVFTSAFVSQFPESLTTDGTTPRNWRLKSNTQKWSIKEGQIYGFSFEVEEAL